MGRYYKYVDAKGVDIIRSLRIKLSDFSQTNDPFEILPRIDYPTDDGFWEREFDRHTEMNAKVPDMKRLKHGAPDEYVRVREKFVKFSTTRKADAQHDLPQQLRNEYSKKVGFICLTTKPDDIVMWAHYADCHKGIVVEFNAAHALFTNFEDKAGNALRVIPVDYRVDRPVLKLGDSFRVELLACKGNVWRYEEEVRVIFHKDFCIKDGHNFFLKLSPDCISGVIIGSQASDNLHDEIQQLNSLHWEGKLSIRKATEDNEHYRINISENDKTP